MPYAHRHKPNSFRPKSVFSTKERTILALAMIQTSFAIWGMGLIHVWSQCTFLGMSVLGMLISFWPHRQGVVYRELDPNQTARAALGRLRSSPLFWMFLLPLGYILIQGLNVGYAYETVGKSWRAFPVEHVNWLPSGVDGPFHKMNPFRLLVIFAGVGLFVTYLYVGLLRRKLWVILGWSVAIQAVMFAVLAFAQIKTNAQLVYWTFHDQTPLGANFLGSIPYYNRGAAAVNLMMGSCMALYFYHLRVLRRQMLKSGPHLMLIPVIFVLYGTLWMSSSRAGILLGSMMVGLFILWVFVQTFVSTEARILRWCAVLLSVGLMGAGVLMFQKLPNFEKALRDFSGLEKTMENVESDSRYQVSKATWEIFQGKQWYGWGAGSWRYMFAYYQAAHPELQYVQFGRNKVLRIQNDANNDWFQFLSELGIVGCATLLPIVFYPLAWVLRRIRRVRMTHLVLLATLAVLIIHGLVDHLLQNMTILALAGLVLAMLLRMPLRRRRNGE